MVFFFLIILFTTSVIFAIGGGIIYLLYLPLKNYLLKKGKLTPIRSRQINITYVLLLFLLALYSTYDAFFPSESFYIDEYKKVTLRDIPASAKFISTHSSYPDFHGDYCSSSQIKLSEKDYAELLNGLNNDTRIGEDMQIKGFVEFNETLQEKNEDKIIKSFVREIPGEEDHYLYIGFYNDNQTIFVNICVT